MQQHYKVLGILYLVMGGLTILTGFLVASIFQFVIPLADDPEATRVFNILTAFLPGLLFIVSVPSIVAGIGLLYNKYWALILAVVLSVFNFFSFPFGTALSVYSIYVLIKEGDLRREEEARNRIRTSM